MFHSNVYLFGRSHFHDTQQTEVPLENLILHQCFWSTYIFSDSYHPAGVCVNLSEKAVHPSWVATGIPGQKSCAVISIPQIISCASPPSPTALLKQEGREVTNLLEKYMCWPEAAKLNCSWFIWLSASSKLPGLCTGRGFIFERHPGGLL